MEKRKIIIGAYDSAANAWTLAACKVTKAQQMQTLVQVPGRYAPLDLSTALTDGQPYYGNATLAVRLESSEGDRVVRQTRIDELVNLVDGMSLHIVLPDHPNSYMVGRVQVQPEYNDLAHCAVAISAVCEPWLYRSRETTVTLTASTTAKTATLSNTGRLAVVPTITVTGDVVLEYEGSSWGLSAGTHALPDLFLTSGDHVITYSGSGTVSFSYREAVLAV